jgi:guanylate kinase
MSDKNIKRRGLMLVISSPSGAGKTTLANMLLESDEHIHPSVSYTTRPPRVGEENGKHYFFIDEKTFKEMEEGGMFLESAEIFGHHYGTPKSLVEEYLHRGEDVVFDIDWQGNRALSKIAHNDVVSVFILPPSKAILKERLINRAKTSKESVETRLLKANSELMHWHEYQYTIVNKDLDESLKKILSILRAERLKKVRRLGVVDFVNQLIEETLE